MKPFNDPSRSYIAAIAATLREKPTNPAPEETHDRYMQDMYDPHALRKFALEFDEETEAKIRKVIREIKIPEFLKPPKFPDSFFLRMLWSVEIPQNSTGGLFAG